MPPIWLLSSQEFAWAVVVEEIPQLYLQWNECFLCICFSFFMVIISTSNGQFSPRGLRRRFVLSNNYLWNCSWGDQWPYTCRPSIVHRQMSYYYNLSKRFPLQCQSKYRPGLPIYMLQYNKRRPTATILSIIALPVLIVRIPRHQPVHLRTPPGNTVPPELSVD